MQFDFSVNIPDYVLWGGLVALIPIGVLVALQLMVWAFYSSAISLGAPVRFELKVWLGLAAYMIAFFVGGAAFAAVFKTWWSGGVAAIIVALGLYSYSRFIDRRRRRSEAKTREERDRWYAEYLRNKEETDTATTAENVNPGV